MASVSKIYVGVNQMFPGIQSLSNGPTIPTSGLIGWFDADDYTSGTTWVDKSVNGLDLTLSGTYSKDVTYGPTILLSNAYGNSLSTSLINGDIGTEYTYIEILRPTIVANFDSSFSLSSGGTGDDCNSLTGFQAEGAGLIAVGRNCTGGKQYYITSKQYSTTETLFVSRRFAYGGTPGSGLVFNVGTTSQALTEYGSGAITARGGITSVEYALGAAGKMAVGSTNGGSYKLPGYYGVSLWYDRQLTNQEVTDIYDYYKSTYSLL